MWQEFAALEDSLAFGVDPWTPVDEIDDEWVKVSGDDPGKHVRAADAGDMGRGRSTRHGDLESQGSSIKLGNADGRYTPGNNASPYRPLSDGTPYKRVVTYPLDGEALPLWAGIVSNWTANFEGAASGVSTADLQSRVSLLGSRKVTGAAFRDLYPWARDFWPLDDQEGADRAVNLARPGYWGQVVGTKGAVDFGITAAPGGYGTCAAFTDEGAGSEYLLAQPPPPPPEQAGSPPPAVPMANVETFAFGAWVWPLDDEVSGDIIASTGFLMRFDSGNITAGNPLSLEGWIEAPLDTAIPHHIYYESVKDSHARLYIDAELVGSTVESGRVGHLPQVYKIGGGDDGSFDGQLSQVFYTQEGVNWRLPTLDEVREIVSAGVEEPQTADKHWERLCTNLGIPALTEGTFTTEILPVPVADRTVADIAGDIEKFERGRIIVDGQDQLVLLSCEAANKYEPDPLVLHPGEDFDIDGGPSMDSSNLINSLSVILPGRGVELNLADDESIAARGEHKPGQETVYFDDYINQWSWATWMINTRAWPRVRIPVITLHADRLHDRGNLAAILALREGDVIQLGDTDHRLPVGMGRWMITVRVDEITHQFDPNGDWRILLTVVDYVPPFVIEGTTGRAGETPGSITLTDAIEADDTEVTVAVEENEPLLTRNTDYWPIPADIDGEHILITEVVGDTSPQTLTIQRGLDGTWPVGHEAGTELSIRGGILL